MPLPLISEAPVADVTPDVSPGSKRLIDRLSADGRLPLADLETLLSSASAEDRVYARDRAADVAQRQFGNRVFVRGLIEFSSHCRKDCLYCGIRKSNREAERYRLSPEQILACCAEGYRLGYRTFVLQSGEDAWYTTEVITDIVRRIRAAYPDCAITL